MNIEQIKSMNKAKILFGIIKNLDLNDVINETDYNKFFNLYENAVVILDIILMQLKDL